MNCSNCEQPLEGYSENLVVKWASKAEPVAQICGRCTVNVITLKIVLTRRDSQSDFRYEGYLPVAAAK